MSSTSTETRGSILSIQDWENLFCLWAQGPAQTESDKCENAERLVRDAIREHDAFRYRTVTTFAQGSYRNRTNVKKESDVDVCVLCTDTFFSDYSQVENVSNATLGFTDATYGFAELKQDVEDALVAKFGRDGITRGDKAFDVHENTYRVAADVVPTFEGRLYYRDWLGELKYQTGTVLQCDKSVRRINNWPEQHYANGVSKHTETSRQFKKKVRILKNLCNHMAGVGIGSAEPIASYLLESLVYNCPIALFGHVTHYEDMKNVIAHLWGCTKDDETARELVEVNGIKYLFHWSQGWTRAAVHSFLQDAWGYVGF